eukprot:tig00001098_g7052.t1
MAPAAAAAVDTRDAVQAAIRGDEEAVWRLLGQLALQPDAAAAAAVEIASTAHAGRSKSAAPPGDEDGKKGDVLAAAARFCGLPLVEHILETVPGLQEPQLQRAACAAAEGGRVEALKRLLAALDERRAAAAAAGQRPQRTPVDAAREYPHVLFYAALGGSLPVLQYLLEERGAARWRHVPIKADPAAVDVRAVLSPPTASSRPSRPAAGGRCRTRLLVDAGLRDKGKEEQGGRRSYLDMDPEPGRDREAAGAFAAAAIHGRLEACRLLASLEEEKNKPRTAGLLCICAAIGQTESLRYLVEEVGADPRDRRLPPGAWDGEGDLATVWAARAARADALRYLAARGVALGPDPESSKASSSFDPYDPFGRKPSGALQAAAAAGSAECLRVVRAPCPQRPLNINTRPTLPSQIAELDPAAFAAGKDEALLRVAAAPPPPAPLPDTRLDAVRALLEAGASTGDPAARDATRPPGDRCLRTPLHAALAVGSFSSREAVLRGYGQAVRRARLP